MQENPGWERSLGENGYMYIYGWAASLCAWNYHNIINQLYHIYNKKSFKKMDGELSPNGEAGQG